MPGEKNPAEQYLEEKRAGGVGSFMRGLGHGAQRAAGESIGLAGPQGLAKGYRVGRGIGGALTQGALGAGTAAAGAGAISLAALGVQKLYDAATKTRDFNSMLEYDPEIAAMHQENPGRVNQMFSTLRMFNPDFTKDPVVAGHYVRTMVGDPAHAGETAVSALDYASKIRHPLSENVFRAAAGGGGKKKK